MTSAWRRPPASFWRAVCADMPKKHLQVGLNRSLLCNSQSRVSLLQTGTTDSSSAGSYKCLLDYQALSAGWRRFLPWLGKHSWLSSWLSPCSPIWAVLSGFRGRSFTLQSLRALSIWRCAQAVHWFWEGKLGQYLLFLCHRSLPELTQC